MSHAANTVDTMIDAIKRRAILPTGQQMFSDDDLVDYIADELLSIMVPKTMSVREEYFVTRLDVSFVDGQMFYDMPTRAIGTKVRDIVLIDSNGNEINIPRLSPEQIAGRRGVNGSGTFGFFFEGNKIGFTPIANVPTDQFRIKYFRRPSKPVLESDAARVISWNTVNNTITLSNQIPDLSIGDSVDIIQNLAPFNAISDSVLVSNISGNAIEVPSTFDFDSLVVDYWVATERHSPVIQLPIEAQDVLIQSAITNILISQDDPGVKAASELYQQKMMYYLDMLKDRAEGEAIKIVGSTNISHYTSAHRFNRYTGRR